MQRLGHTGLILFWRRFLKVFTLYEKGGHLGQWTATILTIFCPLSQGDSTWNSSNTGPPASEEIWNSQHFSHTNIWGPYKCIGMQTWYCCKKVKHQCMTGHYFSIFGRPSIWNDLCKDSAPRYPQFWRRTFLKVFTIYGQQMATISAIFCSPNQRRLQMKFEQNWLRGFREEVVLKC